MNINNENIQAEGSALNIDALCQEFDGQSFYGLEYVLEDFFRDASPKKSNAPSALDWFGF